MTNMRTFWWMALIMMIFWIYLQWQDFLLAKNAEVQGLLQSSAVTAPGTVNGEASQADATSNTIGETPNLPTLSQSEKSSNTVTANDTPAYRQPSNNGERIAVKTDAFEMVLSKTGGDIRQVKLTQYPVSIDQKGTPFTLMDDGSSLYSIAQSGWVSPDKSREPTHKKNYETASSSYDMGSDSQLLVPMTWEANGLKLTKTFEFNRGTHLVKVHYDLENTTDSLWSGSLYSQIIRNDFDNSGDSQFVYTYTGPAIYTEEEKYQKHDFDDLDSSPIKERSTAGWVAMLQHYFLVAAVPNQTEENHFYSRVLDGGLYQIGTVSNPKSVAANSTARFSTEFMIGPKIQKDLKATAEGLELTVDYGFLTVIAQPIYWLLSKIFSFVSNWGWSIILLTILIKLLFYKLSEASYKSMAKMRELSPRLQQLKERYGDDKGNFQKKMMAMYKEEKINPMGGCLPILVQMPVFIALYWVLLESVELRQTPFILWIEDLSQKDPFFVLPIIMGLSMFIQQRLNPAPMEDLQRKIMQIMPFAMTIFFMFFPSGLVLYWVTNNILSIAQQWYITRKISQAAAAKKASG